MLLRHLIRQLFRPRYAAFPGTLGTGWSRGWSSWPFRAAPARVKPVKVRRHGGFFGFLWGMAWVVFALWLAFGGQEARDTLRGFFDWGRETARTVEKDIRTGGIQ